MSKFVLVAPPKEEKESKAPKPATKSTPEAKVSGVDLVARRRGRFAPQRRGRGRRQMLSTAPSLPPRIEGVTAFDCVRRFSVSASASSVAITRKSLGCSVLVVCSVANTTMKSIISSFRIQKITLWPPAGGSVILDINANSSQGAEQALSRESTKISSLPTGITVDLPTVFVPKKDSYLGMWQAVAENSDDQLFALSSDSGAVIDVHLVATIAGATSTLTSATTTSTVAVGAAGVMSLDTSNKCASVGYTTYLW